MASFSTAERDPLRSKQALLVATAGVLLFLVSLVFLTANSAEAHACIGGDYGSFVSIEDTNACDSAYDAWRSGQQLMIVGVAGLIAAVVVGVGRGGWLAVHRAMGGSR